MKNAIQRGLSAILILSLLLALAACGAGSDAEPEQTSVPTSAPAEVTPAPETPETPEIPEAPEEDGVPFIEKLVGKYELVMPDGGFLNEYGDGFTFELFTLRDEAYLRVNNCYLSAEEVVYSDLYCLDPVQQASFFDETADSAEILIDPFYSDAAPYTLSLTEDGLVFTPDVSQEFFTLVPYFKYDDGTPLTLVRSDYRTQYEEAIDHTYPGSYQLYDCSAVLGAWEGEDENGILTHIEFREDGRMVYMETSDSISCMHMYTGLYYNAPNEENEDCFFVMLFPVGDIFEPIYGRIGLLDSGFGGITYETMDFSVQYGVLPESILRGDVMTLYATAPSYRPVEWTLGNPSVKLSACRYTDYAEDGSENAYVCYEVFEAVGDISDGLNTALCAYNNGNFSAGDQLLADLGTLARQAAETEEYPLLPYCCDCGVDILRDDGKVFSFCDEATVWAGFDAIVTRGGYSLDAKTGAEITLGDVVTDEGALKAALADAIENHAAEELTDDVGGTLEYLLSEEPGDDWCWALTDSGIRFLFSEYSGVFDDYQWISVDVSASAAGLDPYFFN